MRCVTMKPPKMLIEASATAMEPNSWATPSPFRPGRQQRADDDHRGDRVGDRHQRRMQRRRHPPHHVVADEAGQHEDGEQRRRTACGRRDRATAPWAAASMTCCARPLRLVASSCAWVGELARPRRQSSMIVHRAGSIGLREGSCSGAQRGMHDLAVLRSPACPLTTSSSESIFSALVSLSTMGVMKFSRLRAEQRGGVGRQFGRQVGLADDLDAVLLHDLAELGQRAVAALLHRHVDDHRAGLHALRPCPRSPAPAPCGRGSARW